VRFNQHHDKYFDAHAFFENLYAKSMEDRINTHCFLNKGTSISLKMNILNEYEIPTFAERVILEEGKKCELVR
jgi:hypothetical protein